MPFIGLCKSDSRSQTLRLFSRNKHQNVFTPKIGHFPKTRFMTAIKFWEFFGLTLRLSKGEQSWTEHLNRTLDLREKFQFWNHRFWCKINYIYLSETKALNNDINIWYNNFCASIMTRHRDVIYIIEINWAALSPAPLRRNIRNRMKSYKKNQFDQ